jgi:beta-lactam-binding protein with PASTA domain
VRRRIPWRTVRLYGLTALAGFVTAYVVVALFFLPGNSSRGQVTTPQLVGLSMDEARHVLDSVGLTFSLGDERPSADVPRNRVVAQSPLPGTSAPRLATVTLDVSAGPRQLRVPTVSGLTLDNARKVLADSGLSAGSVQEEASSAPRGEVLRTKPDAGRVVGEGAAVQLVVSAGPAELTMPDVVGRGPAEAMTVLNQLGLTRVRVDSAAGSGISSGIVVSQQPAAGAGIRTTDRVVLRVSPRP